jgi:hypothetical protein
VIQSVGEFYKPLKENPKVVTDINTSFKIYFFDLAETAASADWAMVYSSLAARYFSFDR